MKFEKVDPEDVPNFREAHRGRLSYPVIKSFLETGFTVAKLDRTGMTQSYQSIYLSLKSYVKNHELPITIFSREGQLYLARLDLDADGNKIENWKQEEVTEAPPLTAAEVTSQIGQ